MVVENGSGCSKSSRNRITYTHGQWLNWYYWYLSDLANHCSFTKSHIYYSGLTLHSGFLTCKSQWSLKSILSTQKEPSFLSVRLGNNIPLWLLPLVFFFFFKVCLPFIIILQPVLQCKIQNNYAHYPDCFHSCGKILINISKSFIICPGPLHLAYACKKFLIL